MQIPRFVCCNPHDGSNHCGHVHVGIRTAFECKLAFQNTLDLTDRVNWLRGCVRGGVDADGRLVLDAASVEELYDAEQAYLRKLGAWFVAESDDELVEILRRQLVAVREDLARNPPARPPVRARRSSSTRKAA